MKLNPSDTVGKYTVLKFLGSGAFGTVYLMHDNLLNRDVAVKLVENQNPTAFVAHFEGQLLNQCRHERVVSVNSVEVIQDSGGRYFAAIDMEYMDGGSAQDLVESTFVSIRRAIRILIDVLFGLEHAHRQNILHRDVKPANFMLQGGLAKLSDFGLAANAAASLTASGAGSPVYCAPEVINDNITNEQTDIYAAGMSLFQLANNISNLGARISSIDTIKMGRVISTVGYENYVPRRLRYVCNKACAPAPERRYQSVAEMRQALERLRVKQDWTRLTPEFWQATIKGNDHQLTIEDTPPLEMVYRANGRRKNANCKVTSSVAEAANAMDRWVYNNTF